MAWLALPLSVRILLIVAAGLILGPLVNWAIYRLAYDQRTHSPWGPAPAEAPPRRGYDRLPVLGWLSLRRESPIHGGGFWIRPLLIELTFPVAVAWYYHFTIHGGFLPAALQNADVLAAHAGWLHFLYVAHTLLFIFLVIATFIDFDEQTIPDLVTLPGTLIGLILSALSLHLLMPTLAIGTLAVPPVLDIEPLWFFGTGPFPSRFMGATGLIVALLIVAAWCFALLDRRIILRRGYAMAVRFFFHGIFRHPSWLVVAGLWAIGSLAVLLCYAFGPVASWQGVLNALIGLAGGGLTVWSVRIVAWLALRKEAMGFGDVTFLAMIGVFLGWQAALTIFFLAPIVALGFAFIQLLLRGDRAFPFGPYLSVGTVLMVVFWDPIWNDNVGILFTAGPIIPFMLLFLLAALGILLLAWRTFERIMLRR